MLVAGWHQTTISCGAKGFTVHWLAAWHACPRGVCWPIRLDATSVCAV